jgi:hypothetical protein
MIIKKSLEMQDKMTLLSHSNDTLCNNSPFKITFFYTIKEGDFSMKEVERIAKVSEKVMVVG